MAIWPSGLPQLPQKAGYSEKPANNSIRSKMDVGPAKSRRRISAGVKDHKLSFVVTLAQLAIFEAFYETTLLSGSLSYTWKHPRTDIDGSWKIKSLPEWSPIEGDYYDLSFDVELQP